MYKLIKVIVDNKLDMHYKIEDENSKSNVISAKAIKDLYSKGLINNISINEFGRVIYGSDIHIERSKQTEKLKLVSRLNDSSGKTVGFICEDVNGKKYNMSMNKVWDMAFVGSIRGIKASLNGRIKTLNDLDIKIGELPIEAVRK